MEKNDNKKSEEFYTLEELITRLEYMRLNKTGDLSYPKAAMVLAKEIEKLKIQVAELKEGNGKET